MKILVLTLFAGVLTATLALAQIPVGTRVGGDVPMSGYDGAGRRDPFLALVTRRVTTGPAPAALTRPRTGLASLTLADVAVTGLTKTPTGMLAILQGPDKQSFVLHAKDQLFDATVKSIDSQGVVFVQMLDGGKPQEIRKALRAAAEVIR